MRRLLSFHIPAAWSWALLIWLIVRLVLSAIGVLLWELHWIPDQSPYGNLYFEIVPLHTGWQGALLGVWQRWDAIHYLRIANYGYFENGLLAFFPLYPVLSRLASIFTGGNILLAMLVVSNAATVAAFALLYQFTEEVFSTKLARLAVVVLAVYPAAVYLYAPYAEPLALCLVLLAYQAARHARWGMTLLAGVAAGLSQPIVIPAVVLLEWEAWQQRKPAGIWAFVAAGGPAIGMGTYFAWTALSHNQSYIGVQGTWGRALQWPWQNLIDVAEMFRTGLVLIGGWINLLALIVAAAAALWGIKRLPHSAMLFQVAVLLMFLIIPRAGQPLDSFARHTLILFPLFIALAVWYQLSKRPIWSLSISAAMFVYLSIAYFLWQ